MDDVLAVFDDVPSTELAGDELSRTASALSSSWRGSAGAVQERGPAARTVGRGLCEQSAHRDPQAKSRGIRRSSGRVFVLRKGQKQNHLARLA